MCKCRFPLCQLHQLSIAPALTLSAAAIPATLQHPESHNIFEQASCPIHTAFIGQRFGSEHWRLEFGSNQRPCS